MMRRATTTMAATMRSRGRLQAMQFVHQKQSYLFGKSTASLATTSSGMETLTPMVQQYLERKKAYPDCMLLFQVGDFYEFFGEDARRASHLLNLALTRKSKQTSAFEDMAGFPLSSLDSYVEKLVMHHGVKVAICNQVESASSARQRGYKSLVDRQVVRIVTPGSLVEDAMLSPAENNYLAAVFALPTSSHWGVAWADVSTGEFVSTTATSDRLASTLLRCSPREVLIPDTWKPRDGSENATDGGGDGGNSHSVAELYKLLDEALPSSCMKTYRPAESFSMSGSSVTRRGSGSGSNGDGSEMVEQSAAASIVDYVSFTQQSRSAGLHVRKPQHLESADHMIIDAGAWKGLEVTKSLAGTKQSSLLQCIDETMTPAGSRLLASHLASPLANIELLGHRLDAVTYFFDQERVLKSARRQLTQVFDIERSIQRLSAGVGTPKDLKSIAVTIQEAQELAAQLKSEEHRQSERIKPLPSMLRDCVSRLSLTATAAAAEQRSSIDSVATTILSALSDEATALNSKNGFVKSGYSAELDKWRSVAKVDPQVSQKDVLQQKYRQLIGSTRLRVGYQPEKGYFIDIPHEENNKLIQNPEILATTAGATVQKPLDGLEMIQSLKNSVRYRTKELKDLNRELMEAAQEVERIEHAIFATLRDQVLAIAASLQDMAVAIAQVDVVCSHAQVALDRNFSPPVLDMTTELHIENGRHAVVEAAHLQGKNSRGGVRAFVPNSLHLVPSTTGDCPTDLGACWLLTGPNMGGKSTFLRQSAQLVILAQIGSYVPASFARIGIVDKLFCRVGSADDLASDKSTFMVEMQETATILTQATSRSFVLMDEVGRGTAVNDGIAIAGAVLEALCEKQVRSLFATHFTVLGGLISSGLQDELQLYRMEVLERRRRENADEQFSLAQLVFSHRVVKGLASHSYGIHTAALAGCPPSVVERAAQLLDEIQLASGTAAPVVSCSSSSSSSQE